MKIIITFLCCATLIPKADALNTVVTSTNNSGAGTLRSAIEQINSTGHNNNTISFNISGALPISINLTSGLPGITRPVVIDGQTQPGFIGDPTIRINGYGIVLSGGSDGSVIRGLDIRGSAIGIRVSSSGNWVYGNYILSGNEGIRVEGPQNIIGGNSSAHRNVISSNSNHAILLTSFNASRNVISGNYVGVGPDGYTRWQNNLRGIYLASGSGSSNVIGGYLTGERNVVSGAINQGVVILGSGNQIIGNYIGTDASGYEIIGNIGEGLYISGNNNVIHSNRIAGSSGYGISCYGQSCTASWNTVYNNSGSGIYFSGSDCTIGPRNKIFSNSGSGIYISGTRIAVLDNSIYSNIGVGIRLGDSASYSNDPTDSDTGPNDLQNYPIVTNVYSSPQRIEGYINSMPTTIYRLEFYLNSTCDGSGYGEGERLAMTADVLTDASGYAAFSFVPPSPLPMQIITATARDPLGNTSHYSPCVAVMPHPNSDGDQLPDVWEFQYIGNLSQSHTNDPDKDGLTNIDEYICGTHPTNGNSYLRLLSEYNDGSHSLRYSGTIDRVYYVDAGSILNGDTWVNIIDAAIGTGGWNVVASSLTYTQIFYRLRCRLP